MLETYTTSLIDLRPDLEQSLGDVLIPRSKRAGFQPPVFHVTDLSRPYVLQVHENFARQIRLWWNVWAKPIGNAMSDSKTLQQRLRTLSRGGSTRLSLQGLPNPSSNHYHGSRIPVWAVQHTVYPCIQHRTLLTPPSSQVQVTP